MTQITLDVTKEECRIIRDALNKYAENEQKYQREIRRYHSAASIKYLLELSELQEKKKLALGSKFSSLYLLTNWK